MPPGGAATAAALTIQERRALAIRARQSAGLLLAGILLFALARIGANPPGPRLLWILMAANGLVVAGSLPFWLRLRRQWVRIVLHLVLAATWISFAVVSATLGDTVTPLLVSATTAIGTATLLPWTVADQVFTVGLMALAYLAVLAQSPPSAGIEPHWQLAGLTITLGGSIYIADLQAQQRRAARVERHWQRRRADNLEAERRHTEETVSDLLDSLPMLFSFIDVEERYRMVNRPYEEWVGRPRAAIVGETVRSVQGDAAYGVIAPNLARALRGEPVQYEAVIPYPDGNPRWVDARYAPRLDQTGRVVGCFVMVTDISARRTAEQRARQSERLAALGTLAAGIAHEINNPAASILAAAEMAQVCLEIDRDDRTIDETLSRIAAEAERCGRIVRSVLRFGREGSPERDAHDLNVVVERGLDLIRSEAAAAGVHMQFDPSPNLPAVTVDDTAIVQVVINLIQNALHEGSRQITVRTTRGPGTVMLAVTDDGHGIAEDDLSRVCDPFYTTHRNGGGSGLGLSVTHGIVASHGGELRIESRVGHGATFTVELPAPRRETRERAPSNA